jgi:uncharacterized membrane protein
MRQFYLFFLYFFLYSMLGWLCEVVYCSIPAKRFINRGFLNGPYCPIYGFGGLIVIILLSPFAERPLLVFLLGMILTSALEYFTSWAMERLFHAKWWDYSQKRFNINGRVCLLNSLLFGLMGVILLYFVQPLMERLIGGLSGRTAPLIALILMGIFAADVSSSLHTMDALRRRLKRLKEVGEEIQLRLAAEEKAKMQSFMDYLEGERSKLIAHNSLFQRRLLDAFPYVKPEGFQEQLQAVKSAIDKARRERKERRKKK